MIELRPFQQRAIDEVRRTFAEHRSVLLYGPTGSGKTVLFSWLAARVTERGKRVTIVVHRDELLHQVSRTLDDFAVPHTYCAAGYGYDRRRSVIVASAQSLVRRLERVPQPDLLVIDEAHHAVGGNTWGRIIAASPNARVLGVSATPCRADGRGLGEMFNALVLGPSTRELIEQGWLAPFKVYAPPGIDTAGLHTRAGDFVQSEVEARIHDTPTLTGDCITHYERLALGKRAVVFCASVAHADAVARGFSAAGHSAASVDGRLAKDLRRRVVAEFARGDVRVLTSCALISEGFDCPGIEAAISLRPTASEGLWLQQVGRALRIAPGKQAAVILDHAGNSHRFGLPDDERRWSLEGLARKTGERAAPSKRCPTCFAVCGAASRQCPECGHMYATAARESAPKQVDGELVEMTARRDARKTQGRAQTLEDLIALGRARGYHPGWAAKVWHGRKRA